MIGYLAEERESPREARRLSDAPATGLPRPADTGLPRPSAAARSASAAPDAAGVVARVVDGDTLELRRDGGLVRVRLLGVDAPEVGSCFARDSTARLRELLPTGSAVRTEYDTESKDRYGRHLLYVWNARGVFVNEALARGGHAVGELHLPNRARHARIAAASDAARRAGAGLWSGCPASPKPSPPASPAPETPEAPEVPAAPAGLPPGPSAGVPDVDCSDLDGPVWVGDADPHRLDRDGDGIGCDSR
ncbi:thermonuclease family protein [Streptomyces globosus]|uniref:thermonuclease family protein n=1 Tax=Streptomyces globosus TaxID=68209 RepID=UPI001FE290E3|nr:thermonuclease family protein [Streptomyces globosus]